MMYNVLNTVHVHVHVHPMKTTETIAVAVHVHWPRHWLKNLHVSSLFQNLEGPTCTCTGFISHVVAPQIVFLKSLLQNVHIKVCKQKCVCEFV